MSIKTRKIIAALLVILSVGILSSCYKKPIADTSSSSAESSAPEISSDEPGTKFSPVDGMHIDLGDVETLVDDNGEPYVTPKYKMRDKTISFLSHWDGKNPGSVHMIRCMEKYGGPNIDFITVPYPESGSKLQAMVLALKAPDVYKVRNGDTATLMRRGLFKNLTNDFNWDERNWRDLKPYLDMVTYNGEILIAPEINSNYFIWFNKSVFDEHNVENPLSIYEKGEWTLDKFDEMCKRLTISEGGNVQTYGFGYDHTWMRQVFAFFDAQLYKKSGDSYINTIAEDEMTDAVEYLNKQINEWKVTCSQDEALRYFAGGKLAMLWYGNWLSSTIPFAEMSLKKKIDLVPAPENTENGLGPRQDYVLGGHAIPKGAKNIEAAKAFIEIFNFFKQTPELDRASTDAYCELSNWSYDQFMRMRKPRYYDNKYAFTELSVTWDYILDSVESGQSWLSVRDMYSGQIDLTIEGIENSIKHE